MKKFLKRSMGALIVSGLAIMPCLGQMVTKNHAADGVTVNALAKRRATSDRSSRLVKPEMKRIPVKGITKQIAGGSHRPVDAPTNVITGAASDMPVIYGSCLYSSTWAESNPQIGLYKIPTSDGMESQKLFAGPKAQFGGVCYNGYYYATTQVTIYGMFLYNEVSVYDVNTGEQVGEPMHFDDMDVLALGLAVHPWGDVWGITYNKDGSAYQISWIEYTPTSVEVTDFGTVDAENVHAFAIDKDGNAYAIISDIEVVDGKQTVSNTRLVKVDLYSGALTEVGPTGVNSIYTTGACIDPKSNRMFWTVSPEDETGNLYEVNLETGAATKLVQFADNAEYAGIYVAASASDEGTPDECRDVMYSFNDDSLTGTVTLTAPSTLIDGETPGSGNLDINVYANEQLVKTASAEWGESVTIDIDLSDKGAGKYSFYVVPSNDKGDGPASKTVSMWIGADTPEATSASLQYVNGNMEVSWNAVSASVNGGYINLDNITYTVLRADGTVAAEGLDVTTFTEQVAEPDNLTQFYYDVIVEADGNKSNPSRTNDIWLGAVNPPYVADFSTGLNGWTVLDANNDNSYWKVYNGVLRIIYNPSHAMDDWAFTPAINVEANKAYRVSFDTYSKGPSFAERIEVMYGPSCSPEGMTKVLLDPTDIIEIESEPRHVEKTMVSDSDGKLYIGLHGISDAYKWYLYVANFRISEAVDAVTPGAPTELSVVPDNGGELTAGVSLRAPSDDMTGNPLASLSSVNLERDGVVVKTFENPQPGEVLTYDDLLTQAGSVTYTAYGVNEFGKGLEADATVFVGYSLPDVTSEVTISRTETDGEAVVTWAPVTNDVNGKRYGNGDVKYNLYKIVGQTRSLISGDLSQTSFSYQAVPAGQQEFIRVAVYAKTAQGEGNGYATSFAPIGTPYAGLNESFPNGQLTYNYLTAAIDGGSWTLCNDQSLTGISASDGDNGYLAATAQYVDQGSELITGMISLEGMANPGISFFTYNIIGNAGEEDTNIIKVSVKTPDSEVWTEVFDKTVVEICGNGVDGWSKASVSLAEYANQTVQIKLTAICQVFSYTMFDSIEVGSLLAYDLKAASIDAPAKAVTGTEFTIGVAVANEGMQAAEGYCVELYADDELVETKNGPTLAPGQRTVVEFEENMSPLASENVTYFANVVYALDQNMTNNVTGNAEVKPVSSTLPEASDLNATSAKNAVTLEWNAPDLSGTYCEPVTYDFEDGDSFADEYGDFIFVDRDGSPVGGFQNLQIPNITSGVTTGSFWVWDQSLMDNNTFKAHSGSKYLFALYRADNNKSDEWAITPELYGSAQTVSFYAKSYSVQYPERIELYYSTGSTDPDDFILIPNVGGTVPADWTLYDIEVPQGAKRFAIRSCASGSFMLLVDDMTLTPAFNTVDLEIDGYNLYRDGVLVNETLLADTEYEDTNVTDGQTYTYQVTVVYRDKGESCPTAPVSVFYSGVGMDGIGNGQIEISTGDGNIYVNNACGLMVDVISIDGVNIYSSEGNIRTVINVGQGIYIVKVGDIVRKVTVR